MNKKINEEMENNLVEDYLTGLGSTVLGIKYGINHTTALNIVKRHGVQTRKCPWFKAMNHDYKRKYKFDEDYFSVIDTGEKSYWVGFISADGCIIYNDYDKTLRIVLKTEDIEHLEMFRKCLNADNPIYTYTTKDGILYSRISISSNKLCSDLINLGVTPKKTYTLKPAEISPQFIGDYIRGYFDGDGCITHNHIRKNGNKDYSVKIVGTDEILTYIKNFIEVNNVAKIHKFYKRHEGDIVSTLELTGNNQVKKFLDLIYEDNNIFLGRKYLTYQQIRKQFKDLI